MFMPSALTYAHSTFHLPDGLTSEALRSVLICRTDNLPWRSHVETHIFRLECRNQWGGWNEAAFKSQSCRQVLLHNVSYCQAFPRFHGWLARPSPGYFLPFRPETSQRCRLWLSCSHGNRRDVRLGRPFPRLLSAHIIRHNFWANSGHHLSRSYTAKLLVASGSPMAAGPPVGDEFSGTNWFSLNLCAFVSCDGC